MKIGITERGDAGLDLSWSDKLNTVDGAILITKKLTDECIEKIIENQEKIILHLTCTGYGGSILEPNVPDYKWQVNQVNKLINKGFNSSRVVLRIDPIIPTDKGIQKAQDVLNYMLSLNVGIERVRISIIDMYPHVRERFIKEGLPCPYDDSFYPSKEQVQLVNKWVKLNFEKYIDGKIPLVFECCAEVGLHFCKSIGCISEYDLMLLNLSDIDKEITGYQRKGCQCLSCKTELLSNKHPCENNCLYCYWKY